MLFTLWCSFKLLKKNVRDYKNFNLVWLQMIIQYTSA